MLSNWKPWPETWDCRFQNEKCLNLKSDHIYTLMWPCMGCGVTHCCTPPLGSLLHARSVDVLPRFSELEAAKGRKRLRQPPLKSWVAMSSVQLHRTGSIRRNLCQGPLKKLVCMIDSKNEYYSLGIEKFTIELETGSNWAWKYAVGACFTYMYL